jgi:hypothetical protein
VDDARQRGVAAQPGDAHVERAAAVDRPGEHLVAERFSTGSDSPVTGAWLTWLSPAATTPSSGIFSPGCTMTTSPTRSRRPDARTAAGPRRDERFAGARSISALMAPRARSIARASSSCASANRKTTAAASRPFAEDHRAGDGDEHQHVDVERQRSRRVQRPPDAVDAAAGDREHVDATTARRSTCRNSSAIPAATRTPRRSRTAASRGRRRGPTGSSCSSHARMPGLRDRFRESWTY